MASRSLTADARRPSPGAYVVCVRCRRRPHRCADWRVDPWVNAHEGRLQEMRRAPSLRTAAVAACDIRDNRTWLEALRGNLRLQIIRPALPTRASIHFDARRQRSSHVVRMVVHCEPPFQKMTLLAMLTKRRTNNLKGLGNTLTSYASSEAFNYPQIGLRSRRPARYR